MNPEIERLQNEINELKNTVQILENQEALSYRQILRLKNALQGSKTYYVTESSPTGPSKALTFKDGILQDEA